MKPRWLRRHVACPECGYIPKTDTEGFKTVRVPEHWDGGIFTSIKVVSFDCPQCKAHFTYEDFWNEQYEKWDRTHAA